MNVAGGRMSWLQRTYREVDADASRTDHAETPARAALLSGVLLSGALLVAGVLTTFLRHEIRPDRPPAAATLWRDLLQGRGYALLYAGVLVLAATPVLRVVVMAGVYLRRRELFMLVVSLIVLGLLAVSMILGTG